MPANVCIKLAQCCTLSVVLHESSQFFWPWGFISGEDKPIFSALLEVWTASGSKQVIGQAEIFPVLLARKFLQGRCQHRRILVFVDNDSARQALSKGRSP